jgi:hypothetical protein
VGWSDGAGAQALPQVQPSTAIATVTIHLLEAGDALILEMVGNASGDTDEERDVRVLRIGRTIVAELEEVEANLPVS